MSRSIIAALGFASIALAASQSFGYHEVTVSKDGVAGEPIRTSEASITFDNLEPGSYTASAQSFDTEGVALAPAVTSEPVIIPALPPEMADVVNSITLTLGAPVDPPAEDPVQGEGGTEAANAQDATGAVLGTDPNAQG